MAAGAQPPIPDLYFHFIPTIWLMTAPSVDPPKAPYLPDTDIHEIFREENWSGGDDPRTDPWGTGLILDQYELLTPAFKLASKFLTNDACLSWWTTLCLSTVTTDPATQRRYLPHVASTPATRAQVRQILTDLAPRVRLRFAGTSDYGDANPHSDHRYRPDEDLHIIRLHANHLLYMHRHDVTVPTSPFDRAPPSRRLCFFYHFAVCLVHEVAHAVCRRRHDHTLDEPFHALSEPEEEMGSSWETFLFQGKMQTLNGLQNASRGLVWWQWRERRGHYDGSLLGEQWYWGVYMVWIEALFRELTWRKVDALGLREIAMRTCGDRARSSYDLDGWSHWWNHVRRGAGGSTRGVVGGRGVISMNLYDNYKARI